MLEILVKCIANVNMSGRSGMKRKYPSGASKRKKKKDATKNTSRISIYFSDLSELLYTSQNNDENILQDAVENLPENSPNDDITKKLNDVNLEKDFPTDRGHFPGDISDAALKRTIIEHGPCRPKDPKHFSSRDEKKTFLWNIIAKLQITLQYHGYGYIIPLRCKSPIVTAHSLLAA